MSKQKEDLIEQIASNIHEKMKISPLASRIYALLIFSSYDGLTFNSIKDYVQASKSSISVSINKLLDKGYIEYYTKSGDRKRFFKADKYYYMRSLMAYQDTLKIEIQMLDKITEYNKKHHPDKYIRDKSIGDITLDHMIKTQALLVESLEKMKAFRLSETQK